MNSALPIFQRTRRPLNILAGVIFITLSLVFGSIYLRDMLKKNLARSQAELNAQQGVLADKQVDLSNIRKHIDQFRVLKQQGLVGNADREGWVEQLVASWTKLRVGEPLNYNLNPPRPVSDAAATPDQQVPDPAANAGASPDVAMMHDLDIEMRGIQEQELVRLLRDFRDKVNGRFRLQSCHLSDPSAAGLVAQCTLRFFNLPESSKKP